MKAAALALVLASACGPGPMLEPTDEFASTAPVAEALAALGGRGLSSVHPSIQPQVYVRDGWKCAGEDFNAGILNPEGQCTDGYSFGSTIVLSKWSKWSESALCHELMHFIGWDHDGGDFAADSKAERLETSCEEALGKLPEKSNQMTGGGGL